MDRRRPQKTREVILLGAGPNHVSRVDLGPDLRQHPRDGFGARLEEYHTRVDASALPPRLIFVILRSEERATVDLAPVWRPVIVASNHGRWRLELEEILYRLQWDDVQVEEQHLLILD